MDLYDRINATSAMANLACAALLANSCPKLLRVRRNSSLLRTLCEQSANKE